MERRHPASLNQVGSLFGHEIRSSIHLSRSGQGRANGGRSRSREGDESILESAGEVTLLQPGDDATVAEPFAIATVEGGHLVVCGITGGYLLDPERLTITAVRRGSCRGLGAPPGDGRAPAPALGPGRSRAARGGGRIRRRGVDPLWADHGREVDPREGLRAPRPAGALRRRRGAGRAGRADPRLAGRYRSADPERGPDGPRRRVEPLPHADVPPLAPAAIVLLEERGPELVVEPLERAEALLRLSPHLCTRADGRRSGVAFGAARIPARVRPGLRGVPSRRPRTASRRGGGAGETVRWAEWRRRDRLRRMDERSAMSEIRSAL